MPELTKDTVLDVLKARRAELAQESERYQLFAQTQIAPFNAQISAYQATIGEIDKLIAQFDPPPPPAEKAELPAEALIEESLTTLDNVRSMSKRLS